MSSDIENNVRKNAATLSQAERDKLRNAMLAVNKKLYPDGVSYWYKQDQMHEYTPVHGGPAFLPWHRELLNRYEAMLKEVDDDVSLHYWDWTTDPRNSADGKGGTVNLFTNTFMGSSSGPAGAPFAGQLDNNGVFTGSRDQTRNPADPPAQISRNVQPGAPGIDSDATIINSANTLPNAQQWGQFRVALERFPNHDRIHGWIGGNIAGGNTAFEDPFVFLLHSNIDRLWAMWQTTPGFQWRLDPNQVYGSESAHFRITENLEPWAGESANKLRPWAPPENLKEVKNSMHPSVVKPPLYDTMPGVLLAESERETEDAIA